jgi:hypothetical protein
MFGREKMRFTGRIVTEQTATKPGMATIYGLYGPSSRDVRYIGMTMRHPYTRLQDHLNEAKRTQQVSYKLNWMRAEMRTHGQGAIVMQVLATVPITVALAEEKRYIDAALARGYRLTNSRAVTDKEALVEDALAMAHDSGIPFAIQAGVALLAGAATLAAPIIMRYGPKARTLLATATSHRAPREEERTT